MNMLTLEDRCCGACEYWLGGRIIVESGQVYTLPEFSGVCLYGGVEAEVSGSCAHWTTWRFSEDCFLQAAIVEAERPRECLKA